VPFRGETFAEAEMRLRLAVAALRQSLLDALPTWLRATRQIREFQRSVTENFAHLAAQSRELTRQARQLEEERRDSPTNRILREANEGQAEQVLQRLHRIRLLCDVHELRFAEMLEFAADVHDPGGRDWITALDDTIAAIEMLHPNSEALLAWDHSGPPHVNCRCEMIPSIPVERGETYYRLESGALVSSPSDPACVLPHHLRNFADLTAGMVRPEIEVTGRSQAVYVWEAAGPDERARRELTNYSIAGLDRSALGADQTRFILTATSPQGGTEHRLFNTQEEARRAANRYLALNFLATTRPAQRIPERRAWLAEATDISGAAVITDAQLEGGRSHIVGAGADEDLESWVVLELVTHAVGPDHILVRSAEHAAVLGRELVDDPHDPATAWLILSEEEAAALDRSSIPRWADTEGQRSTVPSEREDLGAALSQAEEDYDSRRAEREEDGLPERLDTPNPRLDPYEPR
jgi:hypothetical protein